MYSTLRAKRYQDSSFVTDGPYQAGHKLVRVRVLVKLWLGLGQQYQTNAKKVVSLKSKICLCRSFALVWGVKS